MDIFGLTIRRKKALNSVDESRWWHRVFESSPGDWQRNLEVDRDAVLAYHAVFSCMTLIAGDIAKLRLKLVQLGDSDVWAETTNPAYSPVLRKPNPFQNRIQFFENWVLSKLSRGNTYVLKQRDGRNVVKALYVLDPVRCKPLVADDGQVFYELQADNIAGIGRTMIVPASEIIHDRYNCLFHPLVGISAIYACGLAATQGIRIQNNSTHFFGNGSKPGGLLVAPGKIDEADAKRLKEYWDTNFTGENTGRVAVVGNGMEYKSLAVSAIDAQLIEQLGWTAEVVCSTFHVPTYKIGVGEMPKYNNVQALNVEYYTQCLQILFESIELCLDEGLGTGERLGTEFDLEGLLRMDSVAQMEVLDKGKNLMTPNEARRRLDLPPKTGGDSVYRQQQDYSIAALAKRDARDDPFAKAESPAQSPAHDDQPTDAEVAQARARDKALLEKRVRERMNA